MKRVRTLGVAVAALTFAADQGSKLWLLRDFDLPRRQPVAVMPGFDLVLAWNRGILLLFGWLYRTETTLTGLALGLLIGGAAGNLADRFAYGAVVDFVFLHVGSFRWYIFNGADCAIVAGVLVLLVEWVVPRSTANAHKSPRSSQHS